MEIEISDDDVQAFGGDRDKLASWIEGLPLETERLKARQTVIDKAQGDLRAFTDLGLTPAEIKALKDAPGSPDAKDVEKRIKDALDAANAENTEKSNARARSAEVRAQAAELGFIKPAQALALVDAKELAKVTVSDDGDADQGAVKKLLDDLARENPHLLKPTDTTADHRAAGIGGTGSAAKAEVGAGTDRMRAAYASTTSK
ncbi:hypothetical protein [uncultured Microbacterium sp.]|uniref:hypothetical protein n=1 Tax=uncultured Microbacterium sp. TaxID=191216 RepID=UPI0026006A94|nr:hypothetical protein [uncultured Microbacterium sp.]